jgi:NADPH:quinone reductase
MRITNKQGIHGLIDHVGGPVTGELIRSMAFGGKVIINGGMSPASFALHNFDVLLSGIEIKSHVYRYFFNPPVPSDAAINQEIANLSAQPEFRTPLGGIHSLENFRTAITETLQNPQKGKHILKMSK